MAGLDTVVNRKARFRHYFSYRYALCDSFPLRGKASTEPSPAAPLCGTNLTRAWGTACTNHGATWSEVASGAMLAETGTMTPEQSDIIQR